MNGAGRQFPFVVRNPALPTLSLMCTVPRRAYASTLAFAQSGDADSQPDVSTPTHALMPNRGGRDWS